MSATTQQGSFARRALSIRFINSVRSFANGQNTITFTGLRMQVRINEATGSYQGTLDAMIFGLTQEHMNDLFFQVGMPYLMPPNSIQVEVSAGGDTGPLTVIFSGYVQECQADYAAQPEVPLHVISMAPAKATLQPCVSHSFPNPTDVVTILQTICSDAGLTLVNDGVKGVSLCDHTIDGVAYDQIHSVCDAANIGWNVSVGQLTIWDLKAGRKTREALNVGPDSGMVSYPIITQSRLMFRMLFEPRLVLGMPINITSSLSTIKGKWMVQVFSHALDAETPGGQWFTEVIATTQGNAP